MSPADSTLAGEAMRGLLRRCRRDAAADIARFSGLYGLFIEPYVDEGFAIEAPNLHTRLRLIRDGETFTGDLQCDEASMPMADDSFALVFTTCAFESARDAIGLAAECARMLESEGTLLVLGLNPWSPAHLRWMFGGLRAWTPEAMGALLSGLGLEVVGWRYLGARWSASATARIDMAGPPAHGSSLRSGYLLEARRREPGMTPLRVQKSRVRIGSGARAGSARMRIDR
jgi:SAM-dependent methyltransferase